MPVVQSTPSIHFLPSCHSKDVRSLLPCIFGKNTKDACSFDIEHFLLEIVFFFVSANRCRHKTDFFIKNLRRARYSTELHNRPITNHCAATVGRLLTHVPILCRSILKTCRAIIVRNAVAASERPSRDYRLIFESGVTIYRWYL